MIYIHNGVMYWAKECEDTGTLYRFDTKKMLLLREDKDGRTMYTKMSEMPYRPKFVSLPIVSTMLLEDIAPELETEFSAAVAGIIVPQFTGPRR
jgi:hypothetical protein